MWLVSPSLQSAHSNIKILYYLLVWLHYFIEHISLKTSNVLWVSFILLLSFCERISVCLLLYVFKYYELNLQLIKCLMSLHHPQVKCCLLPHGGGAGISLWRLLPSSLIYPSNYYPMKHIHEPFGFLVWTSFFYCYHFIYVLTSFTLGEEKGELESHLRPVTENRTIVSTLVKEFQASSILWEIEETSVTSMWLNYLFNCSK